MGLSYCIFCHSAPLYLMGNAMVMNSIQDHDEEYLAGLVSEGGFNALIDAEIYGNVTSVSALEKRLHMLLAALNSDQKVTVNHSRIGTVVITNKYDFMTWCSKYFPSANV